MSLSANLTLPDHDATGGGRGTTVLVYGAPSASMALAAALPPGWEVRGGDGGEVDVVVLCAATPAAVRLARVRHPGSRVVAVVSTLTDSAVVVEILAGGADACIRGGDARLLAAHLLACGRRITRATALAG